MLFRLFLLLLVATPLSAQILPFPLGANRSDVSWHQFSTDHFMVIYHDGLDSIARKAASVAEAVYPVVTGNLNTKLPHRVKLYLSDLDDVQNAFAFNDDHMYIWLRGILDDLTLGGIRSSGSAKWFRAVITHEFTHIVIAHATKEWTSAIFPSASVPRWFNEGTARFMEPDGWTPDIDQVLRVAAVNARLGYDGLGRLDGVMLYETGHSIVRYITWRFGDSAIANILKGGRSGLGFYDFELAVKKATGESMGEIYADWRRTLTVMYSAQYGVRQEAEDINPPLTKRFDFVTGIRISPDGKQVAMMAASGLRPQRLYLFQNNGKAFSDSGELPTILSDEPGFDPEFSWSPDGRQIVLSKQRFGQHDALLHDLYLLEVPSGNLRRLTNNATLYDPAWSPDGSTIVAVQKRMGRDQLVAVDPASGAVQQLGALLGDAQAYTPNWSPDSKRIAFSLFDSAGRRAIAIINRDGSGLAVLPSDSARDRYPVWSPDGSRIAITTHSGGVPNLLTMRPDGSDRRYITDVAGGLYCVQWVPNSDSVLAISFDTRDRIIPHLIPASRQMSLTPPALINVKYSGWLFARLPRQTPPADSIPEARIVEEGSYHSLAHITPLAYLPIYGTDRSPAGENGSRWGLFTVMNDPMAIHLLQAFADYGTASKQFGGGASYINNSLPFTVMVEGAYQLGFARVVGGTAAYQRTTSGGASLGWTLRPPNSLTTVHQLSVSGGYRKLEPWNLGEFATAGPTPAAAELVEVGAKYTLTSPKFFFTTNFLRAEPAMGSSIQYNRASGLTAWEIPFGDWSDQSLLVRVEGEAQWGAQLPQEFVGLDEFDQFQQGFSIFSIQPNHRVRGVTRYTYGDRVAVGSIGLLQPFGEPSLGLSTLIFAEAGAAWFGQQTALKDVPLLAGYGAELRLPFLNSYVATFGIAFEMIQKPRRDLYFRLVVGL